jgi:3-methyladenine DNA glycosylase/8-oxoguanine DNA glycosylase
MMMLYGLKTLDRDTFEKYRKRYSPYGTIASLYLWHLSENGG